MAKAREHFELTELEREAQRQTRPDGSIDSAFAWKHGYTLSQLQRNLAWSDLGGNDDIVYGPHYASLFKNLDPVNT